MLGNWLLVVFALFTWRWWLALGQALLADLRVAAEVEPSRAPVSAREHAAVRRAHWNERNSLRRVPAFGRPLRAGHARARDTRRRWEAGFGRRGL